MGKPKTRPAIVAGSGTGLATKWNPSAGTIEVPLKTNVVPIGGLLKNGVVPASVVGLRLDVNVNPSKELPAASGEVVVCHRIANPSDAPCETRFWTQPAGVPVEIGATGM